MKLCSLEEIRTGQVVLKEIQCAFNFVWKIMFSSPLVNIVLLLPDKASTSSYCPNALLKLLLLAFVLESATFVATSWLLSSEASTSLALSPDTSVPLVLFPEASTAFLHCCPQKLRYPFQGTLGSGCFAVSPWSGTTDWFQIGKGVCQGCKFNLYAEYTM